MRFTVLVLFVGISSPALADALPKSMLGRWASDPAACAEQSSELGLTVEPRTILFYEHGYRLSRITRLKDGSLQGRGYSFDTDGKSKGAITLKLIDADTLQARGEIYYRCKNEMQNGGAQ